jgi:RNA polymerase-interacting CarD/CdnL/TRCF family regulator
LACFVEATFTNVATKCCQQVIDGEPEFCEGGLIRVVHRLLQKPNVEKKKVAKELLKAKLKMEAKIGTLTVCSEVVRKLAQLSNEQGQADCENRFDQQISGLVRLSHLAAIEDILGRSIDRCIAIRFSDENEAETICSFLQRQVNLCETYRLSKKVSIDADDIVLTVCGTRKVIRIVELPDQRRCHQRSDSEAFKTRHCRSN